MAKRKNRSSRVVKDNLTTGQRASIALEEEQDLDIKQAFPKYSSFQAEAKLLELSKQDIKNRETGDKAQINKTQRKKILSTAAVEKSIANGFTEEDHLLAAANIKDLYENALLLTAGPDLKNNDTAIIIKRYVAPLVLQSEENQIADVLITQKVSLDKKTERIYSLEIEEIVPEIKSQSGMRPDSGSQSTGRSLAHRNYPAEVVNKLQQKHAKIKSFLEKNSEKNTRYSVSPEISEWEKYVIELLKPVVGERVEMEKKEIAAKVKELYNVELSEDDANLYAYLAAHQNRSDTARRVIAANKRRAFEFYEDMHPFFYHLRQSGENLVINPGREYIGTEFSGSFISEEFRKYSAKRPQNKNESDKSYRRYLERRRKKLDDADGINLVDLAESYTRMYGGDPKTVAAKHFYATISLPTREAPPASFHKRHKKTEKRKIFQKNIKKALENFSAGVILCTQRRPVV